MSKTTEILDQILREDTGRNIVDSGEDFGRSFQKRQKIDDFADKPYVYIRGVDDDYLDIVKNTYHLLGNHLTYSNEMTTMYKLLEMMFPEREIIEDMEDFADTMGDTDEWKFRGNTATNELCMLDAILHYQTFSRDGKAYIVLRIHGGCDVRMGYTKPVVFAIDDPEDIFSDMNEVYCTCKCGNGYYRNVAKYCEYDDFADDDIGANGLPKMWKVSDKEIKCTTCKHTVHME